MAGSKFVLQSPSNASTLPALRRGAVGETGQYIGGVDRCAVSSSHYAD
jgi:hypothetical protein